MRNEENDFQIKLMLEKLEKEGVESIYNIVKNSKPSLGYSPYSSLINDLIGCCPSSQDWQNPRARDLFKNDIIYYCNYYLTTDNLQ